MKEEIFTPEKINLLDLENQYKLIFDKNGDVIVNIHISTFLDIIKLAIIGEEALFTEKWCKTL